MAPHLNEAAAAAAGAPELWSRQAPCSLPQRSALPHLRKGWGVPGPLPASSRPPSFPRKACPPRVVADPHCCSEAAEEKAPLNRGGQGPDPGVRQKSRPERGRRGMVVARSGHAAHFPQPPPQFLRFQGGGVIAEGDVVGFLKAEMQVFASSPFPP